MGCLFASGIWWIWRHRCHEVFNPDEVWSNKKVAILARNMSFDLRNLHYNWIIYSDIKRKFKWEPSPNGTFKVNYDASVLQGVQRASFGCVMRDDRRRWALGRSGALPFWSVYRCELLASWQGLMLAWEVSCQRVICETDSLDAYFVLSNITSHTTHEVKDIVLKLQDFLSKDWEVQFHLIRREANSVADWLNKSGARSDSAHVSWIKPGADLEQILVQESTGSS
ncbi:hypothetical protein AHAS_Ahas06G0122000 [Arachis hypogaea]